MPADKRIPYVVARRLGAVVLGRVDDDLLVGVWPPPGAEAARHELPNLLGEGACVVELDRLEFDRLFQAAYGREIMLERVLKEALDEKSFPGAPARGERFCHRLLASLEPRSELMVRLDPRCLHLEGRFAIELGSQPTAVCREIARAFRIAAGLATWTEDIGHILLHHGGRQLVILVDVADDQILLQVQ